MSPTFYTYIMASRSGTLYFGVTADLARGVHKHGLVPGFTSKYRVWWLVYCEHTNDVGAAIDRDKQLKQWSRLKKMALVEMSTSTGKNSARRRQTNRAWRREIPPLRSG